MKLSPTMLACLNDVNGFRGVSLPWTMATVKALLTRGMIVEVSQEDRQGSARYSGAWKLTAEGFKALGLDVPAPVSEVKGAAPEAGKLDAAWTEIVVAPAMPDLQLSGIVADLRDRHFKNIADRLDAANVAPDATEAKRILALGNAAKRLRDVADQCFANARCGVPFASEDWALVDRIESAHVVRLDALISRKNELSAAYTAVCERWHARLATTEDRRQAEIALVNARHDIFAAQIDG